jgi:hypothetical protein
VAEGAQDGGGLVGYFLVKKSDRKPLQDNDFSS